MDLGSIEERLVRWLVSEPPLPDSPRGLSPAAGSRRPRIAFCANVFPGGTLMGGAELNLFLIARELAARGSVETLYLAAERNPQVPGDAVVEGVRVLQPDPAGRGFPAAPRARIGRMLAGPWTYLAGARADLYHFRCGGPHLTGSVARCHAMVAPVVFSPAHIQDCTLEWVDSSAAGPARDHLYLGGLAGVDLVTCHAEYLSRAIRGRVRCPVETIYAGHPVPPEPGPKEDPPLVLHVGRMKRWKRPDLFVDLAREFAGTRARFVLVGGPGSSASETAFFGNLRDRARGLPKLEMTGALPLAQVEALFDRASLFVNTSVSEGFPNTFIQAWLRRVPTASLAVDPDGIIERNGLGVCAAGDFASLVRSCRDLVERSEKRAAMGDRARAHAIAHHDIRKNAIRHEELYLGLVGRGT